MLHDFINVKKKIILIAHDSSLVLRTISFLAQDTDPSAQQMMRTFAKRAGIELRWMQPDMKSSKHLIIIFFPSSFTSAEEQLKSNEDFSFPLLTRRLSAVIGPLCKRSGGEERAEMRFRSRTREAERRGGDGERERGGGQKVPMITLVSAAAGENLL